MEFYHDSLLSRSISIPIVEMGGNIEEVLSNEIASLEGKCLEEGYLKKGSTQLERYSCGVLKGANIIIQVIFKCQIANPTKGESFICIVENNTRAGIKGRLDAVENPFIVFLARDHHHQIAEFGDIQENEKIKVVILGQRFEINDPKISIIAVLDEMYKPEPIDPISPNSPIYIPKETETPSKPKDKPEKSNKPEVDIFVFKSNSADKLPGKGVNEELVKGHSYPELSKIKDWRRMLSNFDVAEFEWTGEDVLPEPFPEKTRWNSIEHAFQGAKHWWKGHKKEALRFTLNSGDIIGKGDGAEAQKNRKLVKIDDLSGWDELSWKVMASSAEAKYVQNPEKMRMLKATAPAELFHLVTQRGKKSEIVPFKHLEYIRTL
jgi:hypothetical protein